MRPCSASREAPPSAHAPVLERERTKPARAEHPTAAPTRLTSAERERGPLLDVLPIPGRISVVQLLQHGLQGFVVDGALHVLWLHPVEVHNPSVRRRSPVRLPVVDRVERIDATLVERPVRALIVRL